MTDAEKGVCERFKLIRLSLEMKQGDFASEIKTTQGHVSDIENKRKGVSDRVIEIICLKYDVSEEWLRTGTGEMFRELDEEFGKICSDIGLHDPRAREAIEKYYKLSNESKELWWNWADRFMK